jgi:hypothetical protein
MLTSLSEATPTGYAESTHPGELFDVNERNFSVNNTDHERVATDQFRRRMESLTADMGAINRELGNVNLLTIARRTATLLRHTKALIDGNVTVLFADFPDRVPEDLYRHIEYAETHIRKALSEEYEFEVIKQRLFMATALCEYVIDGVGDALTHLEGRIEQGSGHPV